MSSTSSNNNSIPVTQKRWTQSVRPTSTTTGTKPEKRSALGELSNTVKPRAAGNRAPHSVKPNLSVSAQPLASQSQSKSQTQSRSNPSIPGQVRKSLISQPPGGRQPLSRGSTGSSTITNGLGLALKTKPTTTSASSSISLFQEPPSVQVTGKPNLLVHTDPEQTREVREMADLDLVTNKGLYLPTQTLTDDHDGELRDENYPQPEEMGHSDAFYSMRPASVDDEFIISAIPGDIEPEFPGCQNVESENMMTIAEEIEISLSDLSLSD